MTQHWETLPKLGLQNQQPRADQPPMDSQTAKSAVSSTQAIAGAPSTTQNDKRAALHELCARRDAGESLPAAPRPLDLSNERFVELDLSGIDLTGADLSGAELLRCKFTDSRLVGVNLSGAVFQEVSCANVEFLGSDISGADFSNSSFDRCGFGQVTGHGAVFFGSRCLDVTFSGADLTDADFRAVQMEHSRMQNTMLTQAVFAAGRMVEVDLTGASVAGASFRDSDLKSSQLRGVTEYRSADWINCDIQHVDFTGAWLIRRHIQDENYIHEFRTQSKTHEKLYKVWSITSDCGRSLSRWSLWTVLVALIYAGLYTFVDIDWGSHETPLSPVYYSVVTFTTLGYGDVLPGSTAAQVLAMSEVILGYFSLGGMMSILSDKMARRAG